MKNESSFGFSKATVSFQLQRMRTFFPHSMFSTSTFLSMVLLKDLLLSSALFLISFLIMKLRKQLLQFLFAIDATARIIYVRKGSDFISDSNVDSRVLLRSSVSNIVKVLVAV